MMDWKKGKRRKKGGKGGGKGGEGREDDARQFPARSEASKISPNLSHLLSLSPPPARTKGRPGRSEPDPQGQKEGWRCHLNLNLNRPLNRHFLRAAPSPPPRRP